MDKKNELIIIIKWVLGVLMILLAILLSLICLFFALMCAVYGETAGLYEWLCLAVIFPLFNILGTILGNLKSPWFYLFYLPSILIIIVPIIYIHTHR